MPRTLLKSDDGASNLISGIAAVAWSDASCSLSNSGYDQNFSPENTVRDLEIIIIIYFVNRKKTFAREAFISKKIIVVPGRRQMIVTCGHRCGSFKRS